MASADVLAQELHLARERTDRPIAVNLLLPFARRQHWGIADQADVVVTFWGRPVRRCATTWMHQAGSVREALAAQRAGADAVILQGVQAGGHVRGTIDAFVLLEHARAALPPQYPLLLAGGIADASDVALALETRATAAVAGTRFLMTEESGASAEGRSRLIGASDAVLTELFGLGWPAPHQVIHNGATRRWLHGDPPFAARLSQRAVYPFSARLPIRTATALARWQRLSVPL